MTATLAEHDNVDALWYVVAQRGAASVERASIGNLKRTWTEWVPRDWFDPQTGEGREFLRRAVQVKNIWIPYGA
jgi:aldehyde dehydrogenase (NAD+)